MNLLRRLGETSPERALILFSAAVAVFQLLPHAVGRLTFLPLHDFERRVGVGLNAVVDLATPFPVIGAAIIVLASLRAHERALLLAAIGAILYVSGHGIHLAANSIAVHRLDHEAGRATHFWDEVWGHIEWHAGWLLLLASFVAADRRGPDLAPLHGVAAVLLLGPMLFLSAVEGGAWWLVIGAAPLFAVAALRQQTHTARVAAAALVLAVTLVGAWALVWWGVPQPTDILNGGGVHH